MRHQQSLLKNKLFQEGIDWIPSDVLQGLSNKAENFLQDKSNLVVAPGSQSTLIVQRLVHQQASGQISCSRVQYMGMSMECLQAMVEKVEDNQPKLTSPRKKSSSLTLLFIHLQGTLEVHSCP